MMDCIKILIIIIIQSNSSMQYFFKKTITKDITIKNIPEQNIIVPNTSKPKNIGAIVHKIIP